MMNVKKQLLMFLFLLAAGLAGAQNIQLVVDPNPSPFVSDWQGRIQTATLIINNTTAAEIEVKLYTEIFDGRSNTVAVTNSAKMPVLRVPQGISQYNAEDVFPLQAANYKGSLERTMAQTGRLPDDNYQICVGLIHPQTGAPVGTSGTVCKFFTVVSYQAPILQSPSDNEMIEETAIRGVFFRWSPLSPTPRTMVSYRLQIFEVQGGQDPMTALRSNQPIVDKELRGTVQTQWPVDFVLPEARKKYVWTVTPTDDEGRKLVEGNGFAQPFTFSISSGCSPQFYIDSANIVCLGFEGNKRKFKICFKSNYEGGFNGSTNLSYSNTGSGLILTDQANNALTPVFALPLTGLQTQPGASSNSVNYCIDVLADPSVNALFLGLQGDDMNPSPLICIPSDDTTFSTLPDCKCNPCANMGVSIVGDSLIPSSNSDPGQIGLKGTFSGVDLSKIQKITTEIIHFDVQQSKDTACASCVNTSKQFGNFVNPATLITGFTAPVLSQSDYGRQLTWQNETPMDCQDNIPPDGATGPGATTADFVIPVAVPAYNRLPCCEDKIILCVRYTIYDFCCRSCEIIKCYEIKRGN